MMGTIFSGMVVTTSDGRGRAQLVQPGNREWATIIQAVSATGWILLPFIILAAQYHQVSWHQECELPSTWRIRLTDNGWTNNETGLDFIKYFNQYTLNRTQGRYRLLILDGYESHHSTEFELYCKTHNIITLCMLAHSSHKLQPLDIGCFGPLKIAYGQQIEWLIRARINHIIKTSFLCAFREAFFISMTEKNIKSGWAGSGLVPYNPDRVISRLDIQLRTPTPPGPGSESQPPPQWTSKTPCTAIEAASQQELIKARIQNHLNSSPTALLEAVDQLAKGATTVMHRITLLHTEVSTLHKANTALSRQRRAKKTRIPITGALNIQEAQDFLDQKAVEKQLQLETTQGGRSISGTGKKTRCCRVCGKPGHNARTCKKALESIDSSFSDVIIVSS